MLTIHFLCGMGVGALLATVFFLIFLCLLMKAVTTSQKKTTDRLDKQHAELAELHRKRTAGIENCYAALNHIAEWCNQNWSIK